MRNRSGGALLVLVACVVAAVATPLVAAAGVVKLAPTRFRPASGPRASTISPRYFASGDALLLNFVAPVRLPVGATVAKLALVTWGGSPSYASARLLRTRLGSPFLATSASLMFVETSVEQPFLDDPPTVTVTAQAEYPGTSDLVVRRGYRYYVSVQSSNSLSRVGAVEVHYSP